jgi:ATP-dependent DNA ligase
MAKIKHVRTADCVVAGYRVHRSTREAVGSLLLGLYDDGAEAGIPDEFRGGSDGPTLVSVGVVGAFPMDVRRRLYVELQPLVTDFEHHPWHWAAEAFTQRGARGEGTRWNGRQDMSFVPLRPERVVEVRYDHLEGRRFRHTAQFNRWRPDRDPRSCTYAQLEETVSFDLAEVLATPPTGSAPPSERTGSTGPGTSP